MSSFVSYWMIAAGIALALVMGAVRPVQQAASMPALPAGADDVSEGDQTPVLDVSESESLIRMRDDTFYYDYVFVPAGTTVTWVNEEPDPTNAHNILAEDGSFASPLVLPGESWQYTFTTPGYYRYFCELHDGMTGAVLVEGEE